MPAGPLIERIERAWQSHARGAAEQALFALLLSVIVGGAHLARLGTPWARATTGVVIASILAWQIGLRLRRRREAKSERLTVRRVLLATDPALGDRALRALGLRDRTARDEAVGSKELAELHLSRILEKVSPEAVSAAAGRYGQRFRSVTVVLLSCVAVGVVMAPSRVVEGLDVLAARHARAPLPMNWLAYARVSAVPPKYTGETERALVFDMDVELPRGTVVTARGAPREVGRALVLTDGIEEEPFADDGEGGVVARYTVRSDVSLRVAARFGGVRIDDEASLGIHVVPDAPPSVELSSAPRTIRLADMGRLDVRWVARDDHGLRQVDMVLRSGVREERRTLGRFDGSTQLEQGGQVVSPRDPFLRRMFLPISVIVEARDNDPFDGPKWGHSAAITIVPPDVGQPEAERYAALAAVRDDLVDLLKWRDAQVGVTDADRIRDGRERVAALNERIEAALQKTYAGATFPRKLRAFVEGQLDLLRRQGGGVTEEAVERGMLAVDVVLGAIGDRDAADVAKRLADVAEEIAVAAHAARETEHWQPELLRVDAALAALGRGVDRLSVLAALGHDLGGVAAADTGRIRRSRTADDLTHTELAALHLAARLRRPTPSFGAMTGSSHGGGVESGRGRGSGGGDASPSPSDGDEEFDRAANAIEQLAEEHQDTVQGVESALDDARRVDSTDAEREQAKHLADEIRDAIDPLPLPGQEFGSPRATAALARELAKAAAHALDDMALQEAADSAENSLSTLDQAERRLDANDDLHDRFAEVRRALQDALSFIHGELDKRKAESESRARAPLEQAGDTERDLAARAAKLAGDLGGKGAALPRETSDQIAKAGSVMQDAARALSEGRGDDALALQREAQRLLEQSRLDRATEPDEGDEQSEKPSPSGKTSSNGRAIATGGDVPGPDAKARAEEFRRRVLQGLGMAKSDRLSPAIRRYAEGLLR